MGDCAEAPVAASAAAETPSASASRRVISIVIIIVSLFLLPALIANELAASSSHGTEGYFFLVRLPGRGPLSALPDR